MYMIHNVLTSLQSNQAYLPTLEAVEQFSLSLVGKEQNSFVKFLEKITEIPNFPWQHTEAISVLLEKWRAMYAAISVEGNEIVVMGNHKAWKCDVKTNLGELLVLFFCKATALPQTEKAWCEIFAYLPTDTQMAWEYLSLVKQVSYALDKTEHFDFLLGTPAHYQQKVTSYFNLLYASKHLIAFENIGISRERLTNFVLAYCDTEMDWFLRNFLRVFGSLPATPSKVGAKTYPITLFWDKCMYLVGAYKGSPRKFYGENTHLFGLDIHEQTRTEKKLSETHEITDMLDFVGKFAEDVRVLLGYIWVCNSWGVHEIYKNAVAKPQQHSLADAWWSTLEQKDVFAHELRATQAFMQANELTEIPYDLGICLKIKHFGILPAYREISLDKAMLENPYSYFFAQYGLRKGLTDYFFDERNRLEALDLAFFKHIAAGKNPATFVAQGMPILNKKEAHILMTVPVEALCQNFQQLILATKIYTKGFTQSDVCRVLLQSIRNFAFTEGTYAFIDAFLHFLSKYQDEAHYALYRHLGGIYDFLLHTQYEQGADFTFKGRTLEALVRQSEEWHITFRRIRYDSYMNQNLAWLRGNVADSIREAGKVTYKFEELLNSRLLSEESATLGHCVSGYASSCYNGNCRIWGIRTQTEKGWKPTLTIELRGKIIHQVKGKYNRTPTTEEAKVVRAWAVEAGFYFQTNDM